MGQANNFSKMGIHTGESIKMEGLMEWGAINGKMMEPSMKETLRMAFVMAKENGQKAKQNIMVVIVKAWRKVTENYIFQVVTFIRVILSKTKNKVMAKCFGLTAVFTKDNGETEYKMERAKSI